MKFQDKIIFKLLVLVPTLAIGLGSTGIAVAQEKARVVSSTPIVKQYNAPQQVCGTSQVIVAEPKTGAGALLGTVAGGLIGNSVGSGAGRAASTALGMVGGAIVGNNLESQQLDAQNVTTCSSQNTLQNITVYQVVYEYAGKQYSVEMPTDPGPFIMVQLNPVVPGTQVQTPPTNSALVGSPTIASTLVAPAPTYIAAPYPYSYPYAYPLGYGYPFGYAPPVSIGFGFYGGWGARHRR